MLCLASPCSFLDVGYQLSSWQEASRLEGFQHTLAVGPWAEFLTYDVGFLIEKVRIMEALNLVGC